MRNHVLLLAGLVALYVLATAVLQALYGPSYDSLRDENCWRPDGQGGWVRHGDPTGPPPDGPSVDIPLIVQYLPVFLPGLLLILFLFTPLSKLLEKKGQDLKQGECAD
jgi:hypothetical protein